MKANPHRNAKGTVIEAGLHKSKGPLATFIVQNGTLKIGDVVVCGGAFGKVGNKSLKLRRLSLRQFIVEIFRCYLYFFWLSTLNYLEILENII